MPVYIGKHKLCKIDTHIVEVPVPTGNYKAGTAVCDDNGVVTFPELDFTPNMITLWNTTIVDLKAKAEENGEEWEDHYVRYITKGFMFMAVYQEGMWVSQGLSSQSSGAYISNETRDAGSCVTVDNNRYSYRLMRSGGGGEFIFNETFNYAIYG